MTSPDNLTIFIVDDDPSVRDALGLLLGVRGYRTSIFASAEAFLSAWRPEWAGCLLLDIRMPGMDGLALQQRLVELECNLPVIVITGHGDVSLARQAFKARASDFLEKPIEEEKLIAAIDEALIRQSSAHLQSARRQQLLRSFEQLTVREKEVMQHVVSGRHNREIAETLGISVRTVEVHKARLMAKLGVDSVAELVRVSMLSMGQ
jgi:FixJ family two-component response regulator